MTEKQQQQINVNPGGSRRSPKSKSSLFIYIAHFMYKTIQSALHKIKALQRGAEEALQICKRI